MYVLEVMLNAANKLIDNNLKSFELVFEIGVKSIFARLGRLDQLMRCQSFTFFPA